MSFFNPSGLPLLEGDRQSFKFAKITQENFCQECTVITEILKKNLASTESRDSHSLDF